MAATLRSASLVLSFFLLFTANRDGSETWTCNRLELLTARLLKLLFP